MSEECLFLRAANEGRRSLRGKMVAFEGEVQGQETKNASEIFGMNG